MGEVFLEGRGINICRGCNHTELFSVIDLGCLPIANELWSTHKESEETFPLHLRICSSCGLGQVEDAVTPTRLFRDYRYLSSISTSFVEHARKYAFSASQTIDFEIGDWVLEIASNDGYLLKHFIDLGIEVLGVEPAENVAKIAVNAGVPTISEFFGADLAASLLKDRGHPRLVVANNVLAHVPDLQDFVHGLAIIAGPKTVISVENPSLMNFLENDQFDTIYHEHYSYLTANSVAKIVQNFGLSLFDLDQISIHGGSNRYWLRLSSANEAIEERVQIQIEAEVRGGLFDREAWDAFSSRVDTVLMNFRHWLKSSFEENRRVFGYGAAAKASTMLNAAKIEKKWLSAIADGSPEKQGRYMPMEGIPIISPEEMFSLEPSDIVVFPWNISDELVNLIEIQGISGIRIWQTIPHLEKIV